MIYITCFHRLTLQVAASGGVTGLYVAVVVAADHLYNGEYAQHQNLQLNENATFY
jgi:hypothetical protein